MRRIYPRWALLFLTAAFVSASPAQTVKPPADNPATRAAWFLSGRQSPDAQPAAVHIRQAFAQRKLVPMYNGARVSHPGAAPQSDVAPAPTSGRWTELGPKPLNTSGSNISGLPVQDSGNVSGRVTVIALDPADASGNTAYVGTAFGGVWKTTNALAASPTFTSLTDATPTLSVGAIGVDASTSPSTIFIGTGEPNAGSDTYYGEGILESADGGVTWTQVVNAADAGVQVSFAGLGFSRILFDPVNPQIVLATTSQLVNHGPSPTAPAGIYRSTDHGRTWTFMRGNPPATDMAYDSFNHAYYVVFTENGVYKSTDQGATWIATSSPFAGSGSVTSIYRGSLAIRSGTVYALFTNTNDFDVDAPTVCTSTNKPNCDTGLVQSTNGGASWTPIVMPSTTGHPGSQSSIFCEIANGSNHCQGFYDIDLHAPAGSTSLIVGGLDIWGTTSIAGLTTVWTPLTTSNANVTGTVHTDQHALVAVTATTWIAGNDGGVWSTANSGSTWNDMNATLGTMQFYGVSADQAATGIVFGGMQDNGTAKLATPGGAWNRFAEGDGGFTASNPATAQQYFSMFPGFTMIRSDDAGSDPNNSQSEVVGAETISDVSSFVTPYVVEPKNTTHILLGTCRVWQGPGVPTQAGAGWAPVSSDLTLGASGAGCTTASHYINDVASAPTDANTAWVVTNDGQVQFSSNLQSVSPTWTNVTAAPLPNTTTQPLSSVAISSSNVNTVYVTAQGFAGVSGQGHVFKTANHGTSWTDITGNLPDAPANWVLIDPQITQNIYVATDVGVFVATDGGVAGEVWQQLGSGLPNTPVLQMVISPSAWTSRQIIAATHGRGMWEIAPVAAVGSFTLAASPAFPTAVAGAAAAFNVNVASGGDTTPVVLTCTAPASGCTVSPSSVVPGNSASVSLTAAAVASGNTAVTIAANDGTNQSTLNVTVVGAALAITATPAASGISTDADASIAVTLTAANSFNDTATVTCAAPFTCTPSGSLKAGGTVTLDVAASSLALGANSIPVTVTVGSQTANANATVTVTSGFTLATTPATPTAVAAAAAAFTLNVGSVTGGDTTAVALTCSANCTVTPASAAPGGTATISLAASAVASGANALTITAKQGVNTKTLPVSLPGNPLAITASQVPPSFTRGPFTPSIVTGTDATIAVTLVNANSFNDIATVACAAPYTCTASGSLKAGGTVTLDVPASSLALGANSIQVSATIGAQTAQATPVSVTVTPPPDFTVTASAASGTDTRGQAFTDTISVTPQNGFSAATTLTCTGAPSEAICSLAPFSVTPNGAAATSTLTLTTTAQTSIPLLVPTGTNWRWPLLALLAALSFLPLQMARPRTRRARQYVRATLWTALLATAMLAVACGSPATVVTHDPGTTVGTYTLTVTATSGALTHTTTISVSVQ